MVEQTLFSEFGLVGGSFVLFVTSAIWFQKKTFTMMKETNQETTTLLKELVANNTEALNKMSHSIGKTILTGEQSTSIFQIIINNHVNKACDDVEKVLVANHISERPQQIKDFLAGEFDGEVSKNAMFLKGFNTPAGDMGKILLELPREKILERCFAIVLDLKATNDNKLKDVRSFFQSCATNAMRELEKRIERNQ